MGGEEGAEVLAGPEPVDVEVRRVVGLEAGEFVSGGGGAEEETDSPLAAERGIGEGEAHFAGGSVADEADGVDGFVGGAGGDEEGAAETEVGWGGGGQGGGSGRGRLGQRKRRMQPGRTEVGILKLIGVREASIMGPRTSGWGVRATARFVRCLIGSELNAWAG